MQTPYASRPWAAEMPSAGRGLRTGLLVALRRRGVQLARLTAAAGLSAAGERALDAQLPLPERFEIPATTWAAIAAARVAGRRVIAVGTSTVRALESAPAPTSTPPPTTTGIATLIIGPGFVPRVVDDVLSGMHELHTSHDAVLRAFADGALVDAAARAGRAGGFRVHEFGDHCLVG